jgi:glycosyltransferase involved in cell wall biosynthesis
MDRELTVRALLLTNLYPSHDEPTRGLFNYHRFHALSQHVEAEVVVPVRWWTRLRRPVDWLQTLSQTRDRLTAHFPSYFAVPGRPTTHVPGMEASVLSLVERLEKDRPFDVLLAAMAYPEGVVAHHLARRLKRPYVIMCLGSDINELAERPELRPSIAVALRGAAGVICVSKALREKVIALHVEPERVTVQHNGVDGDRFQIRDQDRARNELGLSAEGKLLLYVGNLAPEKGVQVLSEAFQQLCASGCGAARLAVVGGGQLDGDLRQLARQRSMEERLLLAGRCPHEEIPTWMAACDVFCLPSFREGCPNVVLEALASGRPVVASRVGGVPELLNEENGIMAPAGDVDALSVAMHAALVRKWDPQALRESVPFLSWKDYGLALHRVLREAVEDRTRLTV